MLEGSGEVELAFCAEDAHYLKYQKPMVNTEEYCTSPKIYTNSFLGTKAAMQCLEPSDRLALLLLYGTSRPTKVLKVYL